MTIRRTDPAGVRLIRGRAAVLPGFRLTLGFTLFYLSALVLLPLAALAMKGLSVEPQRAWEILSSARVIAAFRLSIATAAAAAALNTVFGLLTAWALERTSFPGRRLVDGMIDLPFALPTAVAGITLTAMYAPTGIVGRWLAPFGLKVAYTPLGIILALTFVGLPFVVRSVQPVIQALEREAEEAAVSLGASPWQTFRRVIFPELVPALLTGFGLAFARGLGEYGSVIFIAGNMPMRTETMPLLIMIRLEQFDYEGAAAIAMVYLLIGIAIVATLDAVQRMRARRVA
ncbi:MAG: sulfate ABC transporter permease subunit CysT [Thermoanaerobaculia bacterium]